MFPWDSISSNAGRGACQPLPETLPVRKQEALREQVAVAPAVLSDSTLQFSCSKTLFAEMNGIEVNWYNQILAKKKTPKERRKLRSLDTRLGVGGRGGGGWRIIEGDKKRDSKVKKKKVASKGETE